MSHQNDPTQPPHAGPMSSHGPDAHGPDAHDPDGPAVPGDHVFGLPHRFEDASVVLVPVPFDATCSYGVGSSAGPESIRAASCQVDLFDRRFGRVHERGIFMLPHPPEIAELSRRTRALVEPIAQRGGASAADADAVARIDAAGDAVEAYVQGHVRRILEAGKTPGVIGGEHSVSLGAIKAVSRWHPGVGLLQIDAHMDLRESYMGFRHSHASVILNTIRGAQGLGPVVQVGLRDVSAGEVARGAELGVRSSFWDDLAGSMAEGATWRELADEIVAHLPQSVYVTLDIDGLDPALCPGTGTPVPGGLSWDQASLLLHAVIRSGRRVVGFDLVEVAPSPTPLGRSIDEVVGARLLYRLCGLCGKG